VNLPTGTVTFLFTDTESSTKLWETQSDAMQIALERHDLLQRRQPWGNCRSTRSTSLPGALHDESQTISRELGGRLSIVYLLVALAEAWAKDRAMTMEDAIELA
jgi:hypothetical protein